MMADLAAIRINELLCNVRMRGASDIHFGGGERSALRVDGRLIVLDDNPLPAARS